MSLNFESEFCPYCGRGLSSREIEEKERLYCAACDRVIWKNADPVSAVVVQKGDKILFVKRGIEPGKGKWSLPAGFLEYKENPDEGALRELEEETGLKADKKDLELVDALNMERFSGERVVATVYSTDYENVEGNLKASDDAEKAEFWSIEKLREDEKEQLRSNFVDSIKKSNRIRSGL